MRLHSPPKWLVEMNPLLNEVHQSGSAHQNVPRPLAFASQGEPLAPVDAANLVLGRPVPRARGSSRSLAEPAGERVAGRAMTCFAAFCRFPLSLFRAP